jgi:hypothetical protein
MRAIAAFIIISVPALAQITTIQGTDAISSSRPVINTNFSNLASVPYITVTCNATVSAETCLSALGVGLLKFNGSALVLAALGTDYGDASTNTTSSVDSELALFSGSGGKTLKRATQTGVLKASSGVVSAVTGTGSDCVRVDGTSGPCGSSGVSDVTAGAGITVTTPSTGVKQVAIDSSVVASKRHLKPSGGSDTFTGSVNPTMSLAELPEPVMLFTPDVSCSGASTINVDSTGALGFYEEDGTTNASCTAGRQYLVTLRNGTPDKWVKVGGGSAAAVSYGSGVVYNFTGALASGQVVSDINNRMRTFPVQVTAPFALSNWGMSFSVAGAAGSTVRGCLYNMSLNLVADMGTVDSSATGGASTTFGPVNVDAGAYIMSLSASDANVRSNGSAASALHDTMNVGPDLVGNAATSSTCPSSITIAAGTFPISAVKIW